MRRREFITLLGGRRRRGRSRRGRSRRRAGDRVSQRHCRLTGMRSVCADFAKGLKETGYVEGENVAIEYRWAEGQIRSIAGAGGRSGSPTGRGDRCDRVGHSGRWPPRRQPRPIPIVFIVGDDPVRLGLVASLSRPGGNATGINFFSTELAAKRLELLRELVPGAVRVAVLVNPANATNTETTLRDMEAGCSRHGAANPGRSTPAPAARSMRPSQRLVRERPDALFVGGDPFLNSRRVQLVNSGVAPRDPRNIFDRAISPKSAG